MLTNQAVPQCCRGDQPRVVNVFSGTLEEADVAIVEGYVAGVGRGYEGRVDMDVSGCVLCPGLIDAHMHVESTQVTVPEFARAVVPRGTTAAVLDPHEIANVHGLEGIRYILRSRADVPMSIFVMASSCVPATHMETAGAELRAEDLAPLFDEPGVLGLAEMMNFPGVIARDPLVMAKLAVSHGRGVPVDGHCPGLAGKALNAYVAAGIGSDHESTRPEEAAEKLRRGLYVFIREGSSARNLEALLPIVTPQNSRRCCWATDDRHPGDLLREGHVDHLVRKAIRLGLDPITAIQMGTLNPAEWFGLDRLGYGAIAPGRRADIVVLEDLPTFAVREVLVAGQLVARDGRLLVNVPRPTTTLPQSVHINWQIFRGFHVPVPPGRTRVRAIVALEGQIVTEERVVPVRIEDGLAVADPERDVLKLAVVERHRGTGNVGVGFVTGFGLRRGALASSVAHDSHNIIVVGTNDDDMLAAVREIERLQGGQVAVNDGRVVAELPLPIAGLMSDRPLDQVAKADEAIHVVARALGCQLTSPYMTLSFLALPVIPKLKLTDKGLVDVERFTLVDLWAT
ncbi:MAG: adenine deaminase [Ardenticatenia bacterium]|nr:adenine deaminase [Ardenticatenia bacterium]